MASAAPARCANTSTTTRKRRPYRQETGTFTPLGGHPRSGTDVLFYEGLHGAVVTETVDVARYADLLIGVVPIINLEWIQKLHRDKEASRLFAGGRSSTAILRRMPDYVNYICPQFSRTDVNFPARADGGHVKSVHRPGRAEPG